MEPTSPPEQASAATIVNPTAGGYYRPIHMVRDVKIFPIQENELTTLNMYSGIVTTMASVASVVVGFMLSIWWDVFTNPNKARVGFAVLLPCGAIIIFCIAVGVWATRSRKNELAKILSESRLVQA
jgi:hypothetical protein